MSEIQHRAVVSPTLFAFSIWIILFVLICLSGYTLNALGLPAHPLPMFIFVGVGFVLIARWLVIQRVHLSGDLYELGGFLFVCASVWLYLVAPALPTWMPPSYSGDSALHYAFANQVVNTGQIISNDPGGPTLIAATLAQWLGVPLVRLLHPLAALWLALTAGALYGLACTLLPPRAEVRFLALVAPAYLLWAWDTFAGLILGAHYFFSQAAGQLFVVAFAWYLAHAAQNAHPLFRVLAIASFIAVWVTYPLWLVVPVLVLVWTIEHHRRAGNRAWQYLRRDALVMAMLLLGVLFLARGLDKGWIPFLEHLRVDGAVVAPTFASFGGGLVFASIGLWFARRNLQASVAWGLGIAVVALTLLLVALHLWVGAGRYWYNKSLFLWVFPIALFCVIAFERAYAWLRQTRLGYITAPGVIALVLLAMLLPVVQRPYPPYVHVPLDESDLRVALWAKENLNTRRIHYIGPKSVAAQWLGVALWGEKYPPDLWVGLARLGPYTFEEWYETPGWGEYLFIARHQRHPLPADVRVVYRDGESMIVHKPSPPVATVSPRYSGSVLSLVDWELTRTTFRPGEPLTLTARIHTNQLPPRRVIWRLQLRDLQNHFVAEARYEPFEARFPMQRWPPAQVLTQTFELVMPLDVRPGVYNLQLGLYFVGNGEPLPFTSLAGETDDVIPVGRIKMALPPVTSHELAALTRTDVLMGDDFRLLGYRLRKTSPLRPGDSFKVILYWQMQSARADDYTVFVHLLDSTGWLVAQRDSMPRAGTYPTSVWEPNEIIPDVYTLTIPDDATPGDYYVIVGMYRLPALQRLPVTDAAQRALGDHFELPLILPVE